MVLHAPSIVFHLGAWAVTAVCIFLAYWINFFQKRDWIPEKLKPFIHPDTVARLDYVAAITGVVGMAGVLASAYFGFLDASQIADVNPIDIFAALTGFDNALGNDVLTFKVLWTVIGIEAFAFAGLIRLYFVTIKRESSVFDQHYVFQILYAESTLFGYACMTVVAGAGGIYVYGESLLSGKPILEDLLPGGTLMGPFVILVAIFTILFVISIVLREKVTPQSIGQKVPES